MTRKTEAAYRHLFNFINEEIQGLQPNSVMSDYETALRNAWKSVWPQTTMTACYFHFCQGVKRQASMIPEFISIAKGTRATTNLYYSFMCLPLLPPEHIEPTFNLLRDEAFALDQNLFARFVRYIHRQWIRKVLIQSFVFHYVFHFFINIFNEICIVFSISILLHLQEGPESISVYGRNARTNNCVEAYNGALNKLIHAKGNFYQFCAILQFEEFNKYTTLRLLVESGGAAGETATRSVHLNWILFFYSFCNFFFNFVFVRLAKNALR